MQLLENNTFSSIRKNLLLVINACAVFGGIKILVPSHVDVKVSSTPIFGGVSNTSRKNKSNGKVTVYINATCIFGGVEIR